MITLKVMPNDLDRLDQAIAALRPRTSRTERHGPMGRGRGKSFKDKALIQRRRSLQAEALRIEAEQAGDS